MAVDTSVVVVSHRPGDWLGACLGSVLPQASEVVVVDNGSDGAAVTAVAGPLGARVVRADTNLGFAGGVALALGHARGDLVGVLNDDAVAGPNWLAAARAVLGDPSVAAVTPKVLLEGTYAEILLEDDPWFAPGDARPLGRQLHSVTVDGVEVIEALRGAGVHGTEYGPDPGGPVRADGGGPHRLWRWTSGPNPFYVPVPDAGRHEVTLDGHAVAVRGLCHLVNHAGSFLERHGVAGEYGLGAPDDGRFDAQAERFGFSGTAPVFRAETLRRIGGLEPRFFAYNEDTDWCLRARLAGYTIAYDPGATVVHRLSATSGGATNPRVRFLARRNALLCLARTAPAPMAWRSLWRRLSAGPDDGVRRSVIRALPFAAAVHKVVDDAELRRRFSVAARDRVASFSLPRARRRFVELVTAAIAA
ncbi:MAG TPA: glycosyltransferase family 2 protein [Acidimicrobiales bacterium]|nr:glycosyltransferase family 2 protein [Acidimicrobiales bacterium]